MFSGVTEHSTVIFNFKIMYKLTQNTKYIKSVLAVVLLSWLSFFIMFLLHYHISTFITTGRQERQKGNNIGIKLSLSLIPKILTIQFQGHLGNHMFQYAYAMAMAQEHGYAINFDHQSTALWEYFHIRDGPKIFEVKQNRRGNYKLFYTDQGVKLRKTFRLNTKTMDFWLPCCRYLDDAINMSSSHSHYKVAGYFQSWKYFENIKDEIHRTFQFKPFIAIYANNFVTMKSRSLQNPYEKLVTVGIHVKRGDLMVFSEHNISHTSISIHYFYKAMSYFQEKYKNVVFIVCSDDLEWSKKHLKGPNVIFSEGHTPVTNLAILTRCDHVVLSTGTFSWWAGYLSQGEVVYFKEWPRKGSKIESEVNVDDYFYPTWIPM